MRSLELITDLLAMSGATEIEAHPDRIIQRTPDEPDFWFGNRLIFSDPPEDAAAAIAQFRADLPDVRHICIAWDIPNLPLGPVQALFEGSGLTVDQGDVLTLKGDLHRAPVPEGIVLRAFEPKDWAQSHDIAMEIARDEGMTMTGHRAYLEGRAKARKWQIEAGLAQWFGAFDGGLLVGDMGIVQSHTHIRYQVVQTRKSHRGRGIASALLGFALDWARARAPEALPVIVADAGSDAGRLYRRAGFAPTETTVIAWRAGQ